MKSACIGVSSITDVISSKHLLFATDP